MKPPVWLFALALGLLLLSATPALASSSASVSLLGDYTDEFFRFWKEFFRKQNGVVLAAVGLGAVALLIIMSAGQKRK